jgi:hypothetical protein
MSLIEPGNAVLLLIDYHPMTIFGVRSHDPQDVISKVTALAKTAKGFGVPTILTSAGMDNIGGDYFPEIRVRFRARAARRVGDGEHPTRLPSARPRVLPAPSPGEAGSV